MQTIYKSLYLVSWESKPLLVHLQPYCIPELMWQTIYYYKLKSDSYTIGPNSRDGWIAESSWVNEIAKIYFLFLLQYITLNPCYANTSYAMLSGQSRWLISGYCCTTCLPSFRKPLLPLYMISPQSVNITGFLYNMYNIFL